MVNREPTAPGPTPPPDEPNALQTTILLSSAEQPSAGVDLRATSLDDTESSARYQIGEILGAGGMGVVHLCRDARVGRTVALKRTRTAAGGSPRSDANLRARFLREARIQGQLEHPAVVPVYDLGQHPDGGEFFTMKRVRGRTLSEILRSLRRGDAAVTASHSRHRLLTDFGRVCLAVHYAHSRGVVHRDLKPDNLMLGDFGEVYVLDWGVAKIVSEPDGNDPADPGLDTQAGRTVAGSIIGTLGYAAPEALEGEPVDRRADIYALGAILVEILTFQRLHPGANTNALIADTLDGADARALIRACGQDVPPELEALCVRATARDRGQRIATALELQLELERFLQGDRDLELRREHAREHAAAAESAARELADGRGAIESRKRALYEAGRALALDPDNEAAAAVLLGLLASAPSELPAEAEQALDAAASERVRASARLGAFAYGFALLFVPAVIAIGVLDWSLLLAAAGLFAATLVSCMVLWRTARPRFEILIACFVLSTIAISVASTIFGVYILVPAIMSTNAMAFAAHGGRRGWIAFAAFASAGLLLPLVVEWAGFVAPVYRFAAGHIEVHPRVMALPPVATQAMLVVGLIASVFVACAYSAWFQRALAAAEYRLQLQNWQLGQLVSRPVALGSSIPTRPTEHSARSE